ncbi:MAG TPA: DsrE family protein [Pseudonocardiaceae bacterium]|nr:DsrE family protein [Pseudonocardiaceae bacterium]
MRSTDSGTAVRGRTEVPALFLVESQGGTVSRFLRTARHLAAAMRTPTDVFLIDDGVSLAVDASSDVAGVLGAGGRVWADVVSLSERGIKADELAPGVVVTGLDAVAEPLFDPAVRVVWH